MQASRLKLSLLGHAAVWLGALAAIHFALACNFVLSGEDPKSVPQIIETVQGPRALAFDGEHVWVVFFGAETVAKYSVDGRNIASFSTDSYPRALAFDGEHMWVGKSAENAVIKLSLDGELVDTVSIGTPDTSPVALVFDGESIWVAASWGNSVSKVNLDGTVVRTVRIPRLSSVALGDHP